MPPERFYAYLSQGKLYRLGGGGDARALESAFGRSLRDRAAQIHNRHAWKTQGRGAQFMYGMAAACQESDPGEFRVAITSTCNGPESGSLFYTLETDEVSGIFAVDAAGVEQRLFHTADFRVRHISASPDRGEVAFSMVHPNFCTNIAVMRSDGTGIQEATEGESVDLAPSWVGGGEARKLIFQSAGIGRDSSGVFTRLGPSAIQSLDLDSGDLATIAEDAEADLLAPRMLADGTLLYIRRPYQTDAPKLAPLTVLKDTVMFPFRMSRAIFQFFNFFSMRYTGKPLTSAKGGAQHRQQDLKQMMILGNLVDASKAMEGADRSDTDAPSMVPATWQLMRRRPGTAAEETVAKGVLSFDASADGEIVYSNGSAVYRLAAGSRKAERVVKSGLIEQVVSFG